jgi:hypothetical protein
VNTGVSGGALSLSRAANGYVTMGNVLGMTSGDFSLVAWIRMNSGDTTQDCVLLGKHAAFSRNGYFIHVNQSTGLAMQSANRAFFYEGGTGVGQLQTSETPISTSVINDGQWHQIVAVYKAGGTKTIYVDGAPAEDSKPSQAFFDNTGAFLIGGVNVNGAPQGRITALVDEVQIYNHALKDSDIDMLYQHPTQVALDAEQTIAVLQQQLAAANNTITGLNSQLASAQQDLQTLETELSSIDAPLAHLTHHFQQTFRDPAFQIPGTITSDKVINLVNGIEAETKGVKQVLYYNLGGKR